MSDSASALLLFPAPPQPVLPIAGLALGFPVHRIYCVGQNYARHAQEMGASGREAPFFFMKPADAVVSVAAGGRGEIAYPPLTQDLHHEVELVVALHKGGRDIEVAQAMEHVYGYAVGLDMTRRDLQAEQKKAGRAWSIAKGFDQSAPLGPVVPCAQAGDIERAAISLGVNGAERQSGNIDELIWSVAEVIAALSRAWTLVPGDLIFTGTPAGVGAVVRGDEMRARIDGLPELVVTVV